MRFIVDECTGRKVCDWLKDSGYDVLSIYNSCRGIKDLDILEIANRENRIIITDDKDFGDMIFRDKLPHKGIILLRPQDRRSKIKIEILKNILENYSGKLKNHFVVVTEKKLRISTWLYFNIKIN